MPCRYKDADGDLVLLSSQNDLNELLVLERGVIEVQISPVEQVVPAPDGHFPGRHVLGTPHASVASGVDFGGERHDDTTETTTPSTAATVATPASEESSLFK